jgi:hypothetical protein
MVLEDETDRKMLEEMKKETLLELFAVQVRNIWRVDGLYFLGIEGKYGTDSATEIDADCWRVMGKIEARQLKKIFKVKDVNPDSLLYLLRNTSWALDVIRKEHESSPGKTTFRVVKCGTQETRIKKKLEIFPCKKVRQGYLEAFARELDPGIEVTCITCPPDEPASGVWCEWEFKFNPT